MSEAKTASYEEVPYEDYVFPYTHPSSVGAVAAMLGMRPADPARCRVLELGCGTGANLIPMACDLPGSQFVGIDRSQSQLEGTKRTIGALGLTNIDLRAGDILGVNEDFGRFDYIICHGVYSWVPPDVREAILSICKANLTPNGVAYVSYNTFPGWHMRSVIRDMMFFQARRFDDPAQRMRQVRIMLKFLTQAVDPRDSLYGGLLRREVDQISKYSDAYIYHEYLEDVNTPVYFHQFAERAAAHGLQYMAEAESLPSPLIQKLSPEACDALQRLAGSMVEAEQYLDFVRHRTFRATLLCHDNIPLHRPPARETVIPLYLTGIVRPTANATDAATTASEEFRGPDGSSVQTDNPLLRAALRCLHEAMPAAISFDALFERVRVRLPSASRLELAEVILECYFVKMVELHLRQPAVAANVGEKPCASALARFQAAAGKPICNLRHRKVNLDSFDRSVLQQIDGIRELPALVENLAKLVASGEVEIKRDPAVVAHVTVGRDQLRKLLDASLDRIARNSLLVATNRP